MPAPVSTSTGRRIRLAIPTAVYKAASLNNGFFSISPSIWNNRSAYLPQFRSLKEKTKCDSDSPMLCRHQWGLQVFGLLCIFTSAHILLLNHNHKAENNNQRGQFRHTRPHIPVHTSSTPGSFRLLSWGLFAFWTATEPDLSGNKNSFLVSQNYQRISFPSPIFVPLNSGTQKCIIIALKAAEGMQQGGSWSLHNSTPSLFDHDPMKECRHKDSLLSVCN